MKNQEQKQMLSFHNDPLSKADELILCVLNNDLLIIDPVNGCAYSKRWTRKGVPTKLGTQNQDGYTVCTLHYNGSRIQVKIHRLIWIAVNGNIPDGLVVDHINRVKNDNRIANLRLVTPAENSGNRRSYRGEQNPCCKISQAIAEQIRIEYQNKSSYQKVASKFSVSRTLVAKIIRNELW